MRANGSGGGVIVASFDSLRLSKVPSAAAADIIAANADGSGMNDLTPDRTAAGDAWDFDPDVSPDGTKIAFDRSGQGPGIYVMNADGSGRHAVGIKQGGQPIWAPDSRRIAYTTVGSCGPSGDCQPNAIHVVNDDGSGDRIVARDPTLGGTIAWSPDGTAIAWSSDHELRIVTVASRTSRLLARLSGVGNIAWSPDGQAIAFNTKDGVFTVRPDGLALTSVAKAASLGSWSPDGKQLAVSAGDPQTKQQQIYTLDVATGDRTRLTNSPFSSDTPKWSPDGAKIAFLRTRFRGFGHLSDGADVWVMNRDGSGQVQVTRAYPTGATADTPTWLTATGHVKPDDVPAAVPIPATRVLRYPHQLSEFGADGMDAVSGVDEDGTRGKYSGPIIWSLASGHRSQVAALTCPAGLLTIAGGRLAWSCESDREFDVYTATVASRRPVSVRGGPYDPASAISGSGPLIALTAGQRIWTIVGNRAVPVRSVKGTEFLAADDRRIAIVRRGRSCWLISRTGAITKRFRIGTRVDGFLFRGTVAVVLAARKIWVYDTRSGRLSHTWPVRDIGFGNALEDVRGRFLVYRSGVVLHVLEIDTGRDVVLGLANEAGPVHARLLPAGLVYQYNEPYADQPGVVGFVAQQALKGLFP